MSKDLKTLIEDIHNLFHDPSHKVDPKNLELFGENCKKALQESIEEATTVRNPTLRMSKIGVPDRKLWYEMNNPPDPNAPVELDPVLLTRFLYGHILEELVLFLCREAGHKVEGEQDECDVAGIKGHRDCKIDGVVVDVKSASGFAFNKFKMGTLFKDDPFGYIAQLSGYVQADEEAADYGAFLAINKENGELCLLKVDKIDMVNAVERVEHLKELIKEDKPPEEKCYQPQQHRNGPKGNLEVHRNCSYCPFMRECWSDANDGKGIRTFGYAERDVHLVEIKKLPGGKVTEKT
jgi:hypothetical protein